jgi:hypothetical protein
VIRSRPAVKIRGNHADHDNPESSAEPSAGLSVLLFAVQSQIIFQKGNHYDHPIERYRYARTRFAGHAATPGNNQQSASGWRRGRQQQIFAQRL